MPKLTQPDVAERNLRTSYDDAFYDSRRALVRFALGEKYRSASGGLSTSLTGNLPDDVDMLPRYYEPGQSRRMLTNSALMAQKVCYMQPDPDYPDKPAWKEKVTKGFNAALWKGRPHMGPTKYEEFGEWSAECERMFMDGSDLGAGFVQIGVRDGWTCIQHHPLGRVIWDRHRLGIGRARYIAFVHHLSEEEAVAQFGSNIRKEAIDDSSGTAAGNSLRVVKAVQYFDMGLGDHDPTEMWRLGGLAGRVLSIDENEYGCLPFAYMMHLQTWGMRRPVGRLDFQVADQIMRNAYERYLRLVLERGPGFDAVDTGKMNQEDQEAFEGGELIAALRFEVPPLGKIGDYIQRVAPHEPPRGLFQGLEYLDRMDPGNSGISDADRANVTSSPRTLGEIEQAQAGADSQKEWSHRQYARALERVFYKANYIAAKLHTAPTPISLDGVPFLLNEPGVPQSNLEYWLTPQAWPSVNEDALAKANPLRRMQEAQGKWLPILDNPNLAPYTNPLEILRDLIGDYGEKDVDKFLNPQMIAMAQGESQGMPMTDAMTQPQGDPNQPALPQPGVPAGVGA